MILLRKGEINQVVLTLFELVNPNEPINYTAVFTLDQSEEYQYTVPLTDISLVPESYNMFNIHEGVDVTFAFLGDYEYKVYQDADLAHLVEQGMMRVIDAPLPSNEFTVNKNVKIYGEDIIS